MQRCVFRDGRWGSVAGLHLDYVKWCEAVADVLCSRTQFREWLLESRFYVSELESVSGVILQVDDAYRIRNTGLTKG
jgi:hypothetical protein